MIFTPGKKVYVSYSTGIMEPFTEVLTIKKYENNVLFFQEKSSYYAVECYNASFYGYSHTTAGKVLVTSEKWQLPLASLSLKLKVDLPVKQKKVKMPREQEFRLQLSKI